MDNDIFSKIISNFSTKKEIHNHFNIPMNGHCAKIINKKITQSDAVMKKVKSKYTTITKSCPICNTEFKTEQNHPREKTTCSYSCANTYFRSGIDHGNHAASMAKSGKTSNHNYKTICFHHHKYHCCACNESRIVEVHHQDGNHNNSSPKNLIPLCPTCHKLYHSRYKHEILPFVVKFINDLN